MRGAVEASRCSAPVIGNPRRRRVVAQSDVDHGTTGLGDHSMKLTSHRYASVERYDGGAALFEQYRA